MNVASIITTSAAGTVVLGAAAHVGRKVVKFFQDLSAAAKTGAERSAQLEPNGGSSMRDAVNRIEAHLKVQDEAIAQLRAQDEELAQLQRRPRLRRR